MNMFAQYQQWLAATQQQQSGSPLYGNTGLMASLPVYLHKDGRGNRVWMLTPRAATVDPVMYKDYILQRTAFCISPISTPSTNRPVYVYRKKLDKEMCYNHFMTTNVDEIGVTTPGERGKHGYTCMGVLGYVGASASSTLVPVYRWWSPSTGRHLYSLKQDLGSKLVDEAFQSEAPLGYTVHCPPY